MGGSTKTNYEACSNGRRGENEGLRSELYDQFEISQLDQIMLSSVLPILYDRVEVEPRYNTSPHSEILAEIALYQAFKGEPKFRLLFSLSMVIGFYDLLHPLTSQVYPVIFVGVVTINGLISSLRSPKYLAAKLDSELDEKGMPADYRAEATNSASSAITMVLLTIAVTLQLLISNSELPPELLLQNYAVGTEIDPIMTIFFLLIVVYLIGRVRKN